MNFINIATNKQTNKQIEIFKNKFEMSQMKHLHDE